MSIININYNLLSIASSDLFVLFSMLTYQLWCSCIHTPRLQSRGRTGGPGGSQALPHTPLRLAAVLAAVVAADVDFAVVVVPVVDDGDVGDVRDDDSEESVSSP